MATAPTQIFVPSAYPSAADVAWLQGEATALKALSNALSWAPAAVATAQAAEQAAQAAGGTPLLNPPSAVLQNIASAMSSDRVAADAARLTTIAGQIQALLAQPTVGGSAGGGAQNGTSGGSSVPVRSTNPTTPSPAAATGMATSTMVAIGAAIVAVSGGAYWYSRQGKKRR